MLLLTMAPSPSNWGFARTFFATYLGFAKDGFSCSSPLDMMVQILLLFWTPRKRLARIKVVGYDEVV